MYAVGSLTGVFEIHLDDIRKLGVNLGFRIGQMRNDVCNLFEFFVRN